MRVLLFLLISFMMNLALADDLGEGWVSTVTPTTAVSRSENTIVFDKTNDIANRPIVTKNIEAMGVGVWQWTFDFNWARVSSEGKYSVLMQLGQSSAMTLDDLNQGIGVNLIWGNLGTTHQILGYQKAGVFYNIAPVSGPTKIKVLVDMGRKVFSVALNDVTVKVNAPFDSLGAKIDTVRFATNALLETNFSGRSFSAVAVEKIPVIAPSKLESTPHSTSASLSWDTDKPATDGKAYVRLSCSCISETEISISSTEDGLHHTAEVSNLIPLTRYVWHVEHTDSSGIRVASPDQEFVTSP